VAGRQARRSRPQLRATGPHPPPALACAGREVATRATNTAPNARMRRSGAARPGPPPRRPTLPPPQRRRLPTPTAAVDASHRTQLCRSLHTLLHGRWPIPPGRRYHPARAVLPECLPSRRRVGCWRGGLTGCAGRPGSQEHLWRLLAFILKAISQAMSRLHAPEKHIRELPENHERSRSPRRAGPRGPALGRRIRASCHRCHRLALQTVGPLVGPNGTLGLETSP